MCANLERRESRMLRGTLDRCLAWRTGISRFLNDRSHTTFALCDD